MVLLSELDSAVRDLRAFHQAQGSRGVPASAAGPILVGGVGAIARVIITVEAGKRAADAKGGGHGS